MTICARCNHPRPPENSCMCPVRLAGEQVRIADQSLGFAAKALDGYEAVTRDAAALLRDIKASFEKWDPIPTVVMSGYIGRADGIINDAITLAKITAYNAKTIDDEVNAVISAEESNLLTAEAKGGVC